MKFINGEVAFHSPVKIELNAATGLIYLLLRAFVIKNNLGFFGIEKF